MNSRRFTLLFLLIAAGLTSLAQKTPIDSVAFFLEEKPLEANLLVDFKLLMGDKTSGHEEKGTFTCKFPDSTTVSEEIRMTTRGQYRRNNCYIPPVKLEFHNASSPRLYTLSSLKLVNICKVSSDYEQLLLKEFLCYKMYNLLTDMSFRVRLLKMTYSDKGHKKPFTSYAYLIESLKAMAKRNHCKEHVGKVSYDRTNPQQMLMVNIFEYMMGNTFWSVPVNHNINLLQPKNDSTALPYPVAHDFDFSGMVNAEYAIPAPMLNIETVTERLYRGYPAPMDDIQKVLDIYRKQKAAIYAVVNNFEPLAKKYKSDMIDYLDEFYKTINDKAEVKTRFIDNARKD